MREEIREHRRGARREPAAHRAGGPRGGPRLSWSGSTTDNFTFLGYRDYDLSTENGEDVLTRRGGHGPRHPAGDRERARLPQLRQAPARRCAGSPACPSCSTSPRPTRAQRCTVPLTWTTSASRSSTSTGEVTGERRFLGLYTFSAYSVSAFDIPIVRRKVRYVLEQAGFPEGSHNEKDLLEILETYPRDELFQISKEELFEIAMGILHLQERQRVRLFVRRDTYGRFFSCLVFVPRDRYNTEIRQRMQEILQRALGGTNAEFNVRLSESVLARLHFIVYTDAGRDAGVRRGRDRSPPRRDGPLVDGQPLRRPDRVLRRGAGHRALPQVPRRLLPRLPSRLPRPHRRLGHPAHGGAAVRGRHRDDPLPPARRARGLPGVQAVQAGRAGLALGDTAAAGGHGCRGRGRTPARGEARGLSSGLDLRLRPRPRGAAASSRRARSRRSSRTPSPAPGTVRSRTTGSTASSCSPG